MYTLMIGDGTRSKESDGGGRGSRKRATKMKSEKTNWEMVEGWAGRAGRRERVWDAAGSPKTLLRGYS
jgi:hypothetical protein